ncbi:hypothetical protein VT84_37695 [Gemmata sp. SH-PL17]|uniref:hypothetical protein n=1 Tax=Gemmata sp. SH-PL17 TaxID=1630693 RepID=UPI00078E5846|nr:hypothetical protein [Gemmata sp. SH-PL17]AMV30187.1 hypothetical protein VT84_37695 [Gemmata sp. SH-PL17]
MAIFVNESPDSREVNHGSNGGGEVLKYNVRTTAGETEAQIYLAALTGSFPYFNGFIRNDIKIAPNGAAHLWKVEISYGTTGVGGGDQPLGGAGSDGSPPTNPSGPGSDTTPLTGGFSFSYTPHKLHITHSLETISITTRLGALEEDFHGAINVDKDGKPEGVDIPPDPSFLFKRTVARANVTPAYLRAIKNLCGKVSNAQFYEQAAGEVLYMGCDATFSQAEGWSLTHSFGGEENKINISIGPDITVPSKKGFEYLWIRYEDVNVSNRVLPRPRAAYVERVLESGNFSILEIGT